MSWPSFYGYKYTPIGLRQREVKDETGGKTWSTKVHLPEGGHLLDIERRINPDGSISKTETSCFAPSVPTTAAPQPRTTPRAVDPFYGDEGRPHYDLERQADDIIANFRARHGVGMEGQSSLIKSAENEDLKSRSSALNLSHRMASEATSKLSATEESQRISTRVGRSRNEILEPTNDYSSSKVRF